MSPIDSVYPVLKEGQEELNQILKSWSDAIIVEANNIANKDKHPYIDRIYIKRASKRIKTSGSSGKIWTVRVFLPLMISLIIYQISSLRTPEVSALPLGLHISLWLLPIFSIPLIVILSYVLRDLILP